MTSFQPPTQKALAAMQRTSAEAATLDSHCSSTESVTQGGFIDDADDPLDGDLTATNAELVAPPPFARWKNRVLRLSRSHSGARRVLARNDSTNSAAGRLEKRVDETGTLRRATSCIQVVCGDQRNVLNKVTSVCKGLSDCGCWAIIAHSMRTEIRRMKFI